jgi:hypothetical protein
VEALSANMIEILKYLLPGFLTLWIYHTFTSYGKPSQFERVIQALICSVIIYALNDLTKIIFYMFGSIVARGCFIVF